MDKSFFELQQSRESLDFALESGKMGAWDIDLENDNVVCSREMLRIWNISELEFKNQRSLLQSKVHPEDCSRMVEAINSAISQGTIYELEYRIIPSPGIIRWVKSRGRSTFAPGSDRPVRFAGVVFDITETKQKEEALATAVKARDQFFMIASHELKTPLACLHLQTEVFRSEIQGNFPSVIENEMIDSGLKKQQEHLFRLSRIVDNILSASKLSDWNFSYFPEKVNLSVLINDVLERFQIAAKASGIEITMIKSESVCGLWDRYGIEQVILNLLMNAVKYGNGKPVLIEVGKTHDHAFFKVKDHGIGIKAADQARIFERFERIAKDNRISGLGLGLYISRSIVQVHGGEIQLTSELEAGAEFTVLLPRSN
ncbi:MAG: PAS domain-containing sensor histidine kinase [Bdellovibrionota bacterium]